MKNRNLVIVFVLTLCAISQPVCAAEEETYTGPTHAQLQDMNPIQDDAAKGGFMPAGTVYGNLEVTADGRLKGLELLEERLRATEGALFQQTLQDFTFMQATPDDVELVLNLINSKAAQDSETLVILPTLFRRQAIENQIGKGQLFIAKNSNNDVVGFKKLYVMKDAAERNSILEEEIRCQGDGSERVYSGAYDAMLTLQESTYTSIGQNTVVLYNGADFTQPNYRGKGINRALMRAALKLVTPKTVEAVRETNANELAMVYGLVDAIAGATPGDVTDRTSSIIKCFAPFALQIQQYAYKVADNSPISYDRFTAFKPSFDTKATECEPKPDEYSVEGKGCVLRLPLMKDTDE